MRRVAALLLLVTGVAFAQPGAPRTPNLGLKFGGDVTTNDNFVKLDDVVGNGFQWDRLPPTDSTCPSDGTGGTPTLTLTPTSSLVRVTVADTDGCTLAMDETAAVTGTRVTIVRTAASTGSLVFATISGVQVASTTFVMAQAYDNVTLLYFGDRWIEVARGNL